MTVEAGTRADERVAGRVWVVRLDPYGRPSAGTVKLTCSRPGCPEERFPEGAAAGRRAAVEHVKQHLAQVRAAGGPRALASCVCRAADCAWHTADPTAPAHGRPKLLAGADRCGGAVVLSVYKDRAGRLWRIAETCTRCAALIPGCQILATAVPPARGTGTGQTVREPAFEHRRDGAAVGPREVVAFSDPAPSAIDAAPSPAVRQVPVPPARADAPAASRRVGHRQWGKIGQWVVPAELRPVDLRDELIDLGDAYRAYQARTSPDLAVLAALHQRKADAFTAWADATGDHALRRESLRAEKAAQETHRQRTGHLPAAPDAVAEAAAGVVDGPVVDRLLTPHQAVHARTVLDWAAAHAPAPDAGTRLAVLMLGLRAARSGTGNITGQDLAGWLADDAPQVLERLVTEGWLRLPGTVTAVMASRPEEPTAFTVPCLLPDRTSPFGFGKTTRSRISGWAQKVVSDRKLRKKKASAADRLLALHTAAHACPDGRLGRAQDDGLDLARVAAFSTLTAAQAAEHTGLLVAADWLTGTTVTGGRLFGQLAERVLPLGGLL